ncbi:MAG: hypothetical protein GY913_00970 [Proteobacteria bacterium]|nr:hypothetical protein [Pseudomonadota bacterium]
MPVEIQWDGIGALHKGFFSDQEAMTRLAVALAPWLSETVQLQIRYNEDDHIGHLLIQVAPEQLRVPIEAVEGRIGLAVLAPLTTALAEFRDDIAGRFDFRVASFHIGLDFFRGPVHCRVTAAGDHPPDGKLVSPCVLINSDERCGTPEPGGARFDGEALSRLETCLQ